MDIVLIIRQVGISHELVDIFKRLQKGLKDGYNIDILDDKSSFILDLFEYKFRPMLTEYTDSKKSIEEIAVALQEYGERAEILRSISNYVEDRYKIPLEDGPYWKAVRYNTENVTAELQRMNHQGKSLEHCYRYLLNEVSRIPTDINTSAKPN